MNRINYYSRIISAYIFKKKSQLTFWHGIPKLNEKTDYRKISQYYQLFDYKANYDEIFDENGVIILNYHGSVGNQKYHIAIAQYGLACYNKFKNTGDKIWYDKFMNQVKWHEENLIENDKGVYLWYADFNWDYHGKLKAPWGSGLAQGSGLSLIIRAYHETKNEKYLNMSKKIFNSLITEIKNGGVLNIENNNYWIEEIINPPSHILNGFLWSIMGIYDYYILTKDEKVKKWFDRFINTVRKNLHTFDIGYWSLYEHSGTKIPMLASFFYHSLHIIQLRILYKMTNDKIFNEYANKWEKYKNNKLNKYRALIVKTLFKILYF